MTSDAGTVADYDGSSLVGRWTGGGAPEYNQCREAALAQGGEDVREVRVGSVLCVRTDQGRIARLTVVQVERFDSIRADAVIWNAT